MQIQPIQLPFNPPFGYVRWRRIIREEVQRMADVSRSDFKKSSDLKFNEKRP